MIDRQHWDLNLRGMDSVFFFFSKILTVFIYPFPLFFLIGLVLVYYARGFRQKLMILFLLIYLGVFSSSFMARLLMNSLENSYPPVSIDSLPSSEIVLVLGGMIGTASPVQGRPELSESSDRLVDAVRIYKAKKAKKILFTGGSGVLFGEDYREADLAEKILIDLGVPKADIILERESRNTYENAFESEKLIRSNKITGIILVTSASHFRRAAACFTRQKVEFNAYPTDYRSPSGKGSSFESWIPSPGYLEISTVAIKEWIGILAYSLKGYI